MAYDEASKEANAVTGTLTKTVRDCTQVADHHKTKLYCN